MAIFNRSANLVPRHKAYSGDKILNYSGEAIYDGLLVVDCPFVTEAPSESASFLTLFLGTNNAGTAYSFITYNDWL